MKGGDIDLLLLSDTISFADKVSILTDIKRHLGEQKIDLMVRKHDAPGSDPFVAGILRGAQEIN